MTLKCSICCKRPPTVNGVIKGIYHSNVCRPCYSSLLADQSVSSGHAEYNRSRDFEDRQADIAQPYDKQGKPSADFIALYPERAKSIFKEDELRKYS